MPKNQFIKAFRLRTTISSLMLQIRRKLLDTNNNSDIITLVNRHDNLQKRLEVANKYLKL
jgi:hypothetical protein